MIIRGGLNQSKAEGQVEGYMRDTLNFGFTPLLAEERDRHALLL